MFRLSLLIISMLYIANVFGTTFVPISIKTQINEANSIVYGEVLSKEPETNEEGLVVTKFVLKLDRWIGLENFEGKELSVFTPGGKLKEQVVEIPGAAKMNLGEKVMLLLGKDETENYWVKNLGLGKYSAKKIGNGIVLVNQVFPMDPKIGQIRMERFVGLAERLKKQEFKVRFKDKYEIQAEKQVKYRKLTKGKGRNIASVEASEHANSKMNALWLVLILGLLGGATAAFYSRFFD